MIRKSNTVVSVDVSSVDHVNRNRVGVQGAKALARTLRVSVYLQILNLASVLLGDRGLKVLVDGVVGNTTLLSLNLRHNELSGDSIEGLCEMISGSCVEKLDLSENRLFDKASMSVFSK